MNNTQTQKETANDLFARLVNSEKKSSSSISSTNSSMIDNMPINATDKRLVQLENDLMLNKTLNLDTKLFSKEFSNKDIIEIYGKFNTGKTELMMHLMARYLLPCKWKLNNDLTIDLSEYSSSSSYKEPSQMSKLILINTDAKFNVQRLFVIMEERVKIVLKRLKLLSDEIVKLLQKFLRDCLKNLVLYNCFTNEQFIFSLVACETFVKTLLLNPNEPKTVLPIFIDSINSNFEIFDRYNHQHGLCDSNDHTENFSVQLIKKLIHNFNVCIISSRANLTNKNMKNLSLTENYSSNSYKKWQAIVTKRVELVTRVSEMGSEIFYYRFSEMVNKKEDNSSDIKIQTNMLKVFTRFTIKNDGFTLID